MSLATMANGIRAERAANAAAAPAARERNRLAAGRQWKESKRRAWEKARPAFEGAFQRQFTPERFFYTSGERNRNQFVKVPINHEGKLLPWVNVYNGQSRAPLLHVRPIDAPEDDETMLQCAPEAMYGELAKPVVHWELA